MKRFMGFILILFMTLFLGAINRNNMLFQVEYTKPIAGVQSLNVIFFSAVTGQKAEAFLREIMAMTINFSPPSVEIVGTAWDARGRGENEEKQIPFPNGKSFLVYSPKTKQFSYL
jgi:hypothetical protein